MIGDPYASLRDRCIIIEMTRLRDASREELQTDKARAAAREIELDVDAVLQPRLEEIRHAWMYYGDLYDSLRFLRDRDREIWQPLFALCRVLAPERIHELEECAIDLATLKTRKAKRLKDLADEEERRQHEEYGELAIEHCLLVMGDRDRMGTTELVGGLQAMHLGPWRTYLGDGLTAHALAGLLKPFNIEPNVIRIKSKTEDNSTVRGYLRSDFVRAKKA